ncbi:MAG: glycerol kinase GlpK [Bacteriovoracaceae bacterium]|nr:glycerol kinase GlpK [Bacteriovoracaceae bacterium]
MSDYILAIDNGTTGTTSVLINAKTLELTDKINQEYTQIFPKPGWVEHNLDEIWKTVEYTVSEVLKRNNLTGANIACIGITNQRETTCAFNKNGEPLHNAIVWQDRRTQSYCEELRSKGLSEKVTKKTGLPIDPYFSGTKMHWLLENSEQVKKANESGELKLGTIDTYILYRLTSGNSFATEPSNASRTLLMDLNTTDWDSELTELLGVNKDCLAEIKDSFGSFGTTSSLSFLPDGIPITGILGDQQAALFGQAGFNKGDMKCTYGTGSFLLLNTGEGIDYSDNGLLTTVAYRNKGKTIYALEGSVYIAGAAVQFLRDNLKIISSAEEIEELAGQVKDTSELENLLFFPFFTGLGSPYWKSDAKGAIAGITRDTQNKHIARACLEGICLSINDVMKAFAADFGNPIKEIRVDGGAVVNNLLMQMQSDISECKIIRPKVIETTAYGAALAAAIGVELISFDSLKDFWKEDRNYQPQAGELKYHKDKQIIWDSMIKKLFL